MKLLIICIAFFLLILTIVGIIKIFPSYTITYLKPSNSKHTITRIDYDGKTYFTYGTHSIKSVPSTYIQPVYSGVNSGFEAILYVRNDTAIIYAHYGRFNKVGHNNLLQYKVYAGSGNDPLYYKMKEDTSGKYIVVHD